MKRKAQHTRERGQSLAETGIVLLLLVVLTMGIIDFGRMLMLANMITSATRDAARVASAVPRVDRAKDGTPCNETSIKDIVINQLTDVGLTLTTGDVAIDRAPGAVPPTITVTTTVSIPWIGIFAFVPGMTPSLAVNRAVTFRDEHTAGDGTSC
jgi:Flp pilus assembly protein TadG